MATYSPPEHMKNDVSALTEPASPSTCDEAEKSLRLTELEHSLNFWQATKLYWPAVGWCLFVNLAVVLNGMDGGIIGSLVGMEPFVRQYGYLYDGTYVVKAAWLSAFNYSGSLGSVIGGLFAGVVYDRFGPRIMLAACAVGSIGSIFIQFFSASPAVLFVGELLNGAIVSFYPVIASAFVGEVCPLALRGFAASTTNLAFVIGQFIDSGILKGTGTINNKWSYKIPIAVQWFLPIAMLSLIFFLPDPPYWLCRKGRQEAAEKSLRRLATQNVDVTLNLASITETLRLEDQYKENSGYLECFRGPNLRRLTICVMAFCAQALVGNILFINYAVYFFELAGLSSSDAFSMNLGLTAIGFTGTCISWPLLSYIGRRTAYVYGCAVLTLITFMIGMIDLAPRNTSAPTWAQCSFILAANFVYDITIGPFCFVLLAEVSSAKLRGFTIALANVAVAAVSILCAVAIPYAMNEDQGNWRGKVGFLFAGLGFLTTLYCFFCLPETKGRTFEELDIMFERKVPSRNFKGYVINGAIEAREELHD